MKDSSARKSHLCGEYLQDLQKQKRVGSHDGIEVISGY
jgi:hypothetical protein